MGKFKKIISHPQIKSAGIMGFAIGIGIIAQALVFKKVYHLEVKGLYLIIPGLILAFYEALSMDKDNKDKRFMKTIYWFFAIILANIVILLIPLFNK